MDQSLFNEALLFALKAHEGVTRKNSTNPFILHPMEVATIVASMTENIEVVIAALLHDTVEDAGVTLEEIADKFGVKVAKVNTINMRGRLRRQGLYSGYTPAWKKAIVTLTSDSKGIEFFESMT